MRVTNVTLSKELKIGLPNYSNCTAGVSITWELDKTEEFDFDKGWDIINQQISMQADTVDPAWINVKENKNHYKATIKQPKLSKGGAI